MRTGRPKKHPSEKKSGLLLIRLAKDEEKRLKKAAKIAGKKPATWARETLLANAS